MRKKKEGWRITEAGAASAALTTVHEGAGWRERLDNISFRMSQEGKKERVHGPGPRCSLVRCAFCVPACLKAGDKESERGGREGQRARTAGDEQ